MCTVTCILKVWNHIRNVSRIPPWYFALIPCPVLQGMVFIFLFFRSSQPLMSRKGHELQLHIRIPISRKSRSLVCSLGSDDIMNGSSISCFFTFCSHGAKMPCLLLCMNLSLTYLKAYAETSPFLHLADLPLLTLKVVLRLPYLDS